MQNRSRFSIDRRRLLAGGGSAALLGASGTPARAGAADETERLQRGINAAAAASRIFTLPPGITAARTLFLPDGAHLQGMRGSSILQLTGEGPLLACKGARTITLSGITLSGAPQPGARGTGLADFHNTADVSIEACTIENAATIGLRLEKCGGRISQTRVQGCAESAIFSLDSSGLNIESNRIERCGDNGIQIWRSAAGHDGTRIHANRITDIRARSGGDGQYGNGISLFRAGGITVTDNHIQQCAFSAVRNNSGHNVIIANNLCLGLGETAIFAEFSFEGCIIQGNLIDGAIAGIQIVNFADHKGAAAACNANVIRNLKISASRSAIEHGYQSAIKVEGDVAVTGNVIEGAPYAGIMVGWGPSLRDCAISANVVRGAPIGIAVSVAPGAGAASITGNIISRASRAAIAAMEWDKIASADLARDAPSRFAQIKVHGNQVS